PVERANHQGRGKKVAGKLVVARGDAPPVFDAAEEVFDFVSLAVEAFGAVGFLSGVAAAGGDRQGALIFDLLPRFFAVIGLARTHSQGWSRRVQDFFDDLAVVDLTTGEGEVQRTAFAIDSGMDFRGPAAAADADRLIFLPPFSTTGAAVRSYDRAVDEIQTVA